jgi:hypothetical protein
MNEEIEKILKEIAERNTKEFGPLHEECGMYQYFCRCKENQKNPLI